MITKKKDPCIFHPRRWSKHTILVEGGGYIEVCENCKDRLLTRNHWMCKYCGIPIKTKRDTMPLDEIWHHAFDCPRREDVSIEELGTTIGHCMGGWVDTKVSHLQWVHPKCKVVSVPHDPHTIRE